MSPLHPSTWLLYKQCRHIQSLLCSLSVSPALCGASCQLQTLICDGWSLLACSAFTLSARISTTGMFCASSQSYVGIKRDHFCFHAFQDCVMYSYMFHFVISISLYHNSHQFWKYPSQDLSGAVNGLSEVVYVSWFEIKSILLIKQSTHFFFFFLSSFFSFFTFIPLMFFRALFN